MVFAWFAFYGMSVRVGIFINFQISYCYLNQAIDKHILMIEYYWNRWWQHWIEYVNQDQPINANDGSSFAEIYDSFGSSMLKRPANIDNSDLIYDAASEDSNASIEIHDTLLEGRDYVLLPQEVWNQLYLW